MFRKKSPEQDALEKSIADVHASMIGFDVESDEYAKCAAHLKELHSLLDSYRSERVNPNTVISTLGSIAGIAVIVGYEQVRPFASKAVQFVAKSR